MKLTEKDIQIAAAPGHKDLISHIRAAMEAALGDGAVPIRFAITAMDDAKYHCEFAALDGLASSAANGLASLFEFAPRAFERCDGFNAVFVVPTGIGAAIGGHAGDATPAARVLAALCDKLIDGGVRNRRKKNGSQIYLRGLRQGLCVGNRHCSVCCCRMLGI